MASTVTELMRRRFGGKKGILPSGYTQLEYLENVLNGKARIELAPISSGTRIETYFAPNLNDITGGYGCICGSNSNLQISFTAAGYANVGNQSSSSLFYSNGVKAKVNATFNKTSNLTSYFVNDVDTNLKRSYNYTGNFMLFASTTSNYYPARGKMYSFKMWNSSDELIHDLIPCIDPNNVYGMYDIVGGVFYGSANSNSPFSGG